jgi:hypothetical protein
MWNHRIEEPKEVVDEIYNFCYGIIGGMFVD